MARMTFVSPILALRLGPVDFAEPLWLILLLTLVPVVWLWWHSKVPATRLRKRVELAMRCILITALVLALAGTRIVWSTKGVCVVFAIDQSASVPAGARETIRALIQQEIDKMKKDDQFVIVEFGGDAVLGVLPSPKGTLPPPTKVNDVGRTDIARALRLAMASLPSDRQKRIVLITDGNQNTGDALREARIAAANDVEVSTMLITARAGREVMVEQVLAPASVQKDANFTVRAIITSDAAQSATLIVSRNGQPLPGQKIALKAGTNVVDLPDTAREGGFNEFAVTVIPDAKDGDTFSANNTGHAYTKVEAPGRVLLVNGKRPERDYLADALISRGVTLDVTSPGALPARPADYMKYDCIILNNVGAHKLADTQMIELERWVKDSGGGLIMIGGDDAFGSGGYKGTRLEAVAPVEMDVKRKKNLASLAIVIVLDKSGSMGAPAGGGGKMKMDLANMGAAVTIDLLDERDYALVGAVDTMVKWLDAGGRVLPMTGPNKARLRANTLSNQPGGGGIFCKTALAHAYRVINGPEVDAMTRHVIMFADTQDSEQQEDCVDMARKMFMSNPSVTTSVIGLGDKSDPHVPFQEQVAKAGGGRSLITNDPMALPRLFAKEAFMVARNAFVEKKDGITPTLYTSPLFEGIATPGAGGRNATGVPKVFGYVGTTMKPRATLAAHGLEQDDPLLAHWVIGLGKAVAYTSDVNPRWGKDWVSWDGFAKFWQQTVKWTSRNANSSQLATSVTVDASGGNIVIEAVDAQGKPLNNLQLKGNVVPPDQTRSTIEAQIQQIAPGRYQGRFPASARGTYIVNVVDQKSGVPVDSTPGIMSYPPEFKNLNPNPALLGTVAQTTGGVTLTNLENIFAPRPDAVKTYWPLWLPLLLVVAIGLVLDIAWRRLNVADWFRRGRPAPLPSTAAALGAFKTVRESRRDVATQTQSMRDRIEAAAVSAPDALPTFTDAGGAGSSTVVTERPEAAPPGEAYSNRLMSAKKRAAEQIKEKNEG